MYRIGTEDLDGEWELKLRREPHKRHSFSAEVKYLGTVTIPSNRKGGGEGAGVELLDDGGHRKGGTFAVTTPSLSRSMCVNSALALSSTLGAIVVNLINQG